MADKITWTNERRKLRDLIPWPRNPRQIKTDQAKRLAESFDTFGQWVDMTGGTPELLKQVDTR